MLKDATKVSKPRFGVLFSGGKDSTFAAYIATLFNWKIACLVTLKSENPESFMFHTPNIDITKYQAEAMKLPLVSETTSGKKEEELGDLYQALKKAMTEYNINSVAVGAIASHYQYERVAKICKELNLRLFAPLWNKNQALLLREIIELGMDIRISSVAADGLNKEWLGRKLDMAAYNELLQLHYRIGIHPAGEGGEYESLVLYCPFLFSKRIAVTKAEKIMESECTGTYHVKEVRIVDTL